MNLPVSPAVVLHQVEGVALSMKQVRRKSRQRERIFEFIKASSEHPTAHMVYEALKKEMKSTSIGNVYRNIRILMEQERILSREFGDGLEHFEAMKEVHYHFVCEKCKSVSDFNMPVREAITRNARKLSNHTITSHTIHFYGICEKCEKENEDG